MAPGASPKFAARFTLDAMPGKQLAVDADLNAGLITEAEARQRRKDIQRSADFYGAMDGASKSSAATRSQRRSSSSSTSWAGSRSDLATGDDARRSPAALHDPDDR